MRTRRLYGPAKPFMCRLAALRAHLRRGGLVAYATESCFGLGCDPRNRRAVERVLRAKRRPWHKGLIVVAARFAQAAPLVLPLDPDARAFAERHWPGPYTFLLPASRRAPKTLTGRHTSLAVRVSAHPDTAQLCAMLDMALVSTSANLAGHKMIRSHRECVRQFGRQAWVVPGRIGRRRRPSTIIDIKTKKTLRG